MRVVIKSLAFVICFFAHLNAKSQFEPNFDGKVGNVSISLTGKGFGESNDISARFQTLIDSISGLPDGGTIKLSGEVQLTNIILKSNVHIDIAKGTVIKAVSGKTKPALFTAGVDSREKISNIKVFCSNSDHSKPNEDISEKYVFDIREFGQEGRFRAFMLGNVSNFWISDFYVLDSLTKFSALTLNPVMFQTSSDYSVHSGLRDYEVIASPEKGDVRYVHGENQHTGYGVVQVQCAKNVNFEHLSGIGGVTLRLESGAGIQFVGTFNGREHGTITGIKARDLKLTNGFSCVTLSPHGRINGDVYLEDVKAVSSSFAVKMATGFFDSELVELDENNKKYLVDSVKFRKGRFEGPVIIKNVHADFGLQARGRKQEYDYVEKSIQEQYPWENMKSSPETTKSRIIPSSVAIAYTSIPFIGAIPDTVEGQYVAQIDGPVTSSGFVSCISSFYKNILTSNDRNNVNCDLVSVAENMDKSGGVNVYPNPATDTLNIINIEGKTLEIYTYKGELVQKINTQHLKNIQIDVSGFKPGVYILKIEGSKTKIIKKVLINN